MLCCKWRNVKGLFKKVNKIISCWRYSVWYKTKSISSWAHFVSQTIISVLLAVVSLPICTLQNFFLPLSWVAATQGEGAEKRQWEIGPGSYASAVVHSRFPSSCVAALGKVCKKNSEGNRMALWCLSRNCVLTWRASWSPMKGLEQKRTCKSLHVKKGICEAGWAASFRVKEGLLVL